jgi:hypothetical protein
MTEPANLDFIPTDDLVAALKKRAHCAVIILGRQDERSGPASSLCEWYFCGPAVLAWHYCRMMLAGLERSFVDFQPPTFDPPPKKEDSL